MQRYYNGPNQAEFGPRTAPARFTMKIPVFSEALLQAETDQCYFQQNWCGLFCAWGWSEKTGSQISSNGALRIYGFGSSPAIPGNCNRTGSPTVMP
jgi:hypothetical protein